ncbi:MAG TPA: hypothetical protein VH394_24055 [Thermoanaerobaculia bacterium]|jgi:hypothetical protein|nr:hypothetical protein [Thermoanaerobaculia bacterium]
MKTTLRILLALSLLGLIGCASTPRSAGTRTALDLLRQSEPDTDWDAKSLLHGDLDQDGVEDFALTGIKGGDLFIVGIVKGPVGPSSRHSILKFPWGDGDQGSLCSSKAKIALEPIQEDDPPGRKGLGIDLHDDQCDAFHIYWDAGQNDYDWWRL